MFRERIAILALCVGATLLCGQAPTSGTGSGTKGTSQGSSSSGTTGGSSSTTGTTGGGSSSTSGTSGGGGTGSSSGSRAKKAEPGSLEDLIEKALHHNADIRAAEAKVREVEAELNRVRHQVVAKVATLKHDITTAKKMLEFAEKQVGLATDSFRRGGASQQQLYDALAAFEKQKADLARLETDMQNLTGSWKNAIGAAFSPDGKALYTETDGIIRIWDVESGRETIRDRALWAIIDKSASVQAPMAERIRAALNKPVKIDTSKVDVPFHEAVGLVIQKAGVDVPFRPVGKLENAPILFTAGELPLGAWLQALEDASEARFVVRDYGILITTANRIPQGAITVQEFWKQGDKAKAEKTEPPKMK